jgi:hypothetical protein
MVSAFFGKGASEGFRRAEEGVREESKLNILRGELQQKGEIARKQRLAGMLKSSQERLDKIVTGENSPDPKARAVFSTPAIQSLKATEQANIQRANALLAGQDVSSVPLGLGVPDISQLTTKPTVLPEGARLIQDGETVAEGAPKETPLIREAKLLFPGDLVAQRQFIEGSRKKVPLIQQIGEKESEKVEGKAVGKIGATILEEGRRAGTATQRLQTINTLLENFIAQGGEPGALAGTRIQFSKIAQDLGISASALGLPEDVSAGEALISLSNELALGKVGGEGGMPANQFTEADREFVVATVPNMKDTEKGLKIKLAIGQKIAARKIEASNFYQDKRLEGMGIQEAARAVADRFNKMPIFSPDDLAAISSERKGPQDRPAQDLSVLEDAELESQDTDQMNPEELRAWLTEMKNRGLVR